MFDLLFLRSCREPNSPRAASSTPVSAPAALSSIRPAGSLRSPAALPLSSRAIWSRAQRLQATLRLFPSRLLRLLEQNLKEQPPVSSLPKPLPTSDAWNGSSDRLATISAAKIFSVSSPRYSCDSATAAPAPAEILPLLASMRISRRSTGFADCRTSSGCNFTSLRRSLAALLSAARNTGSSRSKLLRNPRGPLRAQECVLGIFCT